MDQTADMFSKIVNNGPYSDVAPHAQLRIGAAREKAEGLSRGGEGLRTAADRYHNQPVIAADALYREGIAYQKQAATAEYDQSTAGRPSRLTPISSRFIPTTSACPGRAKAITALKAQQVQGNFEIAQFYEKSAEKAGGAVVYYNEVLQLDPNSRFAAQARQRIEPSNRACNPARRVEMRRPEFFLPPSRRRCCPPVAPVITSARSTARSPAKNPSKCCPSTTRRCSRGSATP
jgi:outer membrane protein assembly factor BamD (BamD/ComL family)